MTPTEAAAILRQFNEWRRGEDDDIPQPAAHKITAAIDAAVEMIDRLEAAEKERDAAELMSLALRANIERIERQEPIRDWWDCLIADISAIDCMYRGDPTYAHDAYWMREHVVRMLEQRRDTLPSAKGEEK